MKQIGSLLAILVILVPACGKQEETVQESVLEEKDREFVLTTMEGMDQDVTILLFTSAGECEYCGQTEGFLKDIAALSPRITLEVLSLEKDGERARQLRIDKAPGIALLGRTDYGVRYFGWPTGYEFISFVETIRMIADGEPGLEPETTTALGTLERPVTITVFVTKS